MKRHRDAFSIALTHLSGCTSWGRRLAWARGRLASPGVCPDSERCRVINRVRVIAGGTIGIQGRAAEKVARSAARSGDPPQAPRTVPHPGRCTVTGADGADLALTLAPPALSQLMRRVHAIPWPLCVRAETAPSALYRPPAPSHHAGIQVTCIRAWILRFARLGNVL